MYITQPRWKFCFVTWRANKQAFTKVLGSNFLINLDPSLARMHPDPPDVPPHFFEVEEYM